VSVAQLLIAGVAAGPFPPIYLDANGNTEAGASAGTRGGFINLPEGTYVVRFAQTGVKCTASSGLYGWPVAREYESAGEAAVLVPVAPGAVTAPVAVSCGQ
jgi:hypothetical protein